MDDHIGDQFGDYRLIQILGKGNFGDVYLGEHIKNKKQAAIKVLHARLTSKEDLKDYINELRSLFRLESKATFHQPASFCQRARTGLQRFFET